MTPPLTRPTTCARLLCEHGDGYHLTAGDRICTYPNCKCEGFVAAPPEPTPATPPAKVCIRCGKPPRHFLHGDFPEDHQKAATIGQTCHKFVSLATDVAKCRCESCFAKQTYNYAMQCCPNGLSHSAACTCGVSIPALAGDSQAPRPEPTPAPKVTCRTCQREQSFHEMYRCFQCRCWFDEACMAKHLQTTHNTGGDRAGSFTAAESAFLKGVEWQGGSEAAGARAGRAAREYAANGFWETER